MNSDPYSGGYTSPSGLNNLSEFESVTVYATAKSGFVFSHWLFDGEEAGVTPSITIPYQTVNSSHELTAYFLQKSAAFEISPPKTLVKGSYSEFYLNLKCNENVEIADVRVKLNDPHGVFSMFHVANTWWRSSIATGCLSSSALNRFSNKVIFNINSKWGSGSYSVGIGTHTFLCGHIGSIGEGVTVSNSIKSGTYHLTFEIIFTIESGSFSNPPILTIPWDVTIIG